MSAFHTNAGYSFVCTYNQNKALHKWHQGPLSLSFSLLWAEEFWPCSKSDKKHFDFLTFKHKQITLSRAAVILKVNQTSRQNKVWKYKN